MGAGASTALPDTIDKPTAQLYAGDRFDEAQFDKAANDGAVSKAQFLEAAGVKTDLTWMPEIPGTVGADLRFTFENKHANDPTPYHLQGDEDLHRTLPSAQRAALRTDPRVLSELERFWQVFRKKAISKDEYLAVHAKFATVLIPDLSPDEIIESGEEDWVADAGGVGVEVMGKEQFLSCLFELADLYTTARRWCVRDLAPPPLQAHHDTDIQSIRWAFGDPCAAAAFPRTPGGVRCLP